MSLTVTDEELSCLKNYQYRMITQNASLIIGHIMGFKDKFNNCV